MTNKKGNNIFKKLIAIVCMLSIVLSLSVISITALAEEVAVGEAITYSADFSNGLPDDWCEYTASDYKNGTVQKTDDGISIKHSNASIGASLYYGSLYRIATDLGSVEDFDMSMQFRYLSYDNDSRWIALLYHTKITDGKLEGYDMNIRVNGESAQSTITATPSFTDTDKIKTGATPSDKKFHTMRIVCDDGNVSHYFDGKLIYSYKLSDKYGVLGGVQNEGGFAIIVNRSAIEIASLTISGTKGEENVNKYGIKENYAETYIPQTRLVAAPAVITEVGSKSVLESLSETIVPQNAIFNLDPDLNVIDANGKSIDTIDNVINDELTSRIIPIFRLTSLKQTTTLINWLQNAKLLDFAVVSSDVTLIKKVRDGITYSRAILDLTENDEVDLAKAVSDANKAGANVVMLNEKHASTSNVSYLQARLKAVWINSDAQTELEVADIVNSGAYGICIDDFELAYNTYKNYVDLSSLSRTPFDIAHRGLCLSNYENTLEGCIEAYKNGATHFEIDLKLTKDNEIVIMHDDDISRTTNGSGNVASLTLEQLRQYKVTKNYNGKVLGSGVNIPTLKEFFDEFKDKDIVLVLELKTSDSNLVHKLSELLSSNPEMAEKIIVIAFDVEQLKVMNKYLSEIPTANLNSYTYNGFVDGLIMSGYYNTVVDTAYGNVSEYFMANEMLVRGYMGYCWTYGSVSDVARYFTSGVLGMTNNVAECFNGLAKELTFKDDRLFLSKTDTEVKATVVDYSGKESEVDAKVFMREKGEDGEYVILKYRYSYADEDNSLAYTIYSRKIKVIDSDIYMAPDKLVQAINDLPDKITLDHSETVKSIREAYDLLSEEEKALITNSAKLVEAENKIESLNNENTSNDNLGLIIGLSVAGFVVIVAVVVIIVILKKHSKKE